MMPTWDSMGAVISSLLSVIGLWILFFWFYRDYRLDLHRERLFALRDDLFDLGLSGAVPFDGPAYGLLRGLINASVRHAHRVTLANLLWLMALTHRDSARAASVQEFAARWNDAVDGLEAPGREALRSLRARLHWLVCDQLFFTSPVLVLTLLPAGAFLLAKHVGGTWYRHLRSALGDARVDYLGDQLDSVALVGDVDRIVHARA